MPALPEYRTRMLLSKFDVPLVEGVFISTREDLPGIHAEMPVFLKAQVPGATSRMSSGLVRKIGNAAELKDDIIELLEYPGNEGLLVTEGLEIAAEYYVGCTLDYGSRERMPGGILLFSTQGGSGVESRSGTLLKMPFSIINPPSSREIESELDAMEGLEGRSELAEFMKKVIDTFIGYKLTVLEVNPAGVLYDGSVLAVDCRAEFEKSAVGREDREIFFPSTSASGDDATRLEKVVELINRDDPSGTGFFRQNRDHPPEGSLRVATNLCGGGGKMLWEMTTGARSDIHTMNESDTSGGLSAFKSYRILRVILAQKDAQVLLLTGSGMAFQNQHHLAAAVWKALKESPTPLPALLRFGGTDEDLARELFEEVSSSLPVPVRTYPPEVFPNAMVDDISEVAGAQASRGPVTRGSNPIPSTEGRPSITVDNPPGRIFFFPERWKKDTSPPSVEACPTGFLRWESGSVETDPEARCIGCLMCETAAQLLGNGEIYVQLEMPEEVD